MNRILQLRQDQTRLVAEAAAIVELARKENNRALTVDESTKWDKLFVDINQTRATLKAEEGQAEIAKHVEERRDERHREGGGKPPDEQREAFRDMLRFGAEGLEPERRTHLIRGSSTALDFRTQQTGGPEFRAAQSAVTGNIGGFVVPQGFYAEVQTAMLYYAGMMEVGPRVIDTTMGNDLPIPTSNDTTTKGQILGESTPETTVEIPFGQVIMKAYKYSSRLILVPIELLQDAGVDIEAYIIEMLGIRLGRILNEHFTSGTGVSQPRGVLLDAVLGKTGAGGQTATIIYDDIVDLKYSVNRSYRQNGKWMMNDDTLKFILKLKDKNDRPLILDYLTTLQEDEPEKLLGQSLIVNNDMPALGTTGSPPVGNQALLYGDFRNYWVRRVMALLMLRLVERYADAGQVAFLGFMRADGRMVDAGTHPIKFYANATS